MPYRTWTTGTEMLADDFQTYIGDQVVAQFVDEAQRYTQLPTPQVGQLSTLDSYPGALYIWTGTAWVEPVPYSQSGYHAQTLNAAGGGVLYYDHPFASGNIAIHMTNADDSTGTWGLTFGIIQAQNLADRCGFIARYGNGNLAGNAAIKLMYTATGYRAPA